MILNIYFSNLKPDYSSEITNQKFLRMIIIKDFFRLNFRLFFLFSLFFSKTDLFAQLTVTQGGTAQSMASSIVGPGVIVSNATLNCPTASYGTFTGTSNVGLTNGILLTTGNVNDVPGPAANGLFDMNALSFDNGAVGGDPNITAIEPNATYNTCILQFDVIPICDTLQLSYVFASEEYPEYVCSSFNDVFGFFITGPNPSGGNYNAKNIAVIPGTNIGVAINSINPGTAGANAGGGTCTSLSYSSLYVNNNSGSTIAYDDFTIPMIASVPVTTCQSYHLKLAIADAGDGLLDSGVFLEESGLNCPGTTVNISVLADTATEGCVSGSIKIIRGGDLSAPLTVNLLFTGTAQNGTDYTLTSNVVFGTGQSSITLNIPATSDGTTEGTEIATITGSFNICGTTANTNAVNITITEGPAISFTANNPGCGGNNGSITATPSGGTSPFTYLWSTSPAQSTTTATGLTAGNYSVTVSDVNNCSNNSNYSLVTTPSLTLSTSNTPVACNGGSNGTATVSASSGTTPYSYLWNTSPSQTTSTATGLQAGSYSVTVTDNSGCSNTALVNVNSQSALVLNTTVGNVTCSGGNNGSASVSATGGNTPYSYLWSTGGTSSNIFSLIAGTYSVTVNDNNNCPSSTSVTVNDGVPNANATISPAGPFCFSAIPGNLAAATPGGVWSGSGISNSTTGTFNPQISGPGNHIITYSINSTCGDTDTISISVLDVILNSINSTNVSCYGLCDGSIAINSTGATSFSFDNGTTFQGSSNKINLCSGNYTCIIKNGIGCSDTAQVLISEPPSLFINFLPVSATCFDSCNGYAVVIPSGGISPYYYSWSSTGNTPPIGSGQGTASAGNLCDGTYNLLVTDSIGCIKDTNFIISEPAPGFLIASSVSTLCSGSCDGSATANAFGGVSPFVYQWDANAGFQTTSIATGLCSGSYLVTATDFGLCPVITSVFVNQPTPVNVTVTSDTTICSGASTIISVLNTTGGNGSYVYSWNNGASGNSQVVNPNFPTCFTFIATDLNGCISSPQTTCINFFQPFTLDVSPDTNTICRGSSASFNAFAQGGKGPPYSYTYTWYNGLWNAIQTGSNITKYPPGNFPDTVMYFVVANDGCLKNDTDSVFVIFYKIDSVKYSPPSAIGCEPYVTTFSNLTPNASTCLWDMGDGNFISNCSTFQYSYPTAGNYIVDLTIYTADGCSTSVSPASLINVNPLPIANFSYVPENPTVVNTLVIFTNSSQGQIVFWDWTFYNIDNTILGQSQNINSEFTFPSDTGVYSVNLEVTTLNGCKDDTTLYLYVDNEFQLWIPNSFTPNGDGKNDFFPPKGLGINPDRFVLYIFDRWGDLIFESHNLNDPWDGTAREVGGKKVIKQDVYIWKIVTEEATREGKKHTHIGNVTLLR